MTPSRRWRLRAWLAAATLLLAAPAARADLMLFPTRIVFDKNQPLLDRLRPGMSVVTNIDTGDGRK